MWRCGHVVSRTQSIQHAAAQYDKGGGTGHVLSLSRSTSTGESNMVMYSSRLGSFSKLQKAFTRSAAGMKLEYRCCNRSSAALMSA